MRILPRRHRPMVLETERFRLVSMSRAQVVRQTFAWSNDKEIMAGFNETAGGWKRRRWRRRFRRFDDAGGFCFGIWPKEGGPMIGIHTISLNKAKDTATLSVMIGDRAWWGRKVVTEVRGYLVDWLFRTLRVHRVTGMTHSRNMPSLFNYRALGFVYEGAMREHMTGLEGKRLDMVLFGLLRPEWEAKQRPEDLP